jgi:hypothetical protein
LVLFFGEIKGRAGFLFAQIRDSALFPRLTENPFQEMGAAPVFFLGWADFASRRTGIVNGIDKRNPME